MQPTCWKHVVRHLAATCPACGKVATLSAAPAQGVTFDEPLCMPCRDRAVADLAMDDFDVAYARARARGWAD
jgi:hypothetical protein